MMLTGEDRHPFEGMDVASLLRERARLRPDHPFIIWVPNEGDVQSLSYAAFEYRVRRIAGGLIRRGVGPGDRVLIHLDNCPEALTSWYACIWLGAVPVTTNARAAGAELSYFAAHSQAVGGITQPRFATLVADHCRDLRWLAVTDHDNGDEVDAARRPSGDDRFAALDGEPAAPRPADPLAACSVQYTSGTTSRPKGVLWTHANALWGARINAAHETLRADDRHLVHLPLFHTNAQAYSVLACLWVGATAVIVPRFSASRFWPVSIAHRCTWTSLIPFCVKALMTQDLPATHSYRLWGSAVESPPSDAHFGIPTMGWWGMTETITHGIVSDPALPGVPMSIGRPAPEYGIAIVDNDAVPVRDARPVESGESGCLMIRGIRGLSLFREYLDDPVATEQSFDPQGWFRTGDRVELLESGAIRFGDRSKDMLKVGGENVAASEIERVVATVPGVRECAVVAGRDPMLDEVPVLFIRVDDRAPADLEQRIMRACEQELARFKWPREIRRVNDFPRSTLEKIAKAQLRRQLAGDAD